MIEVEAIAAYLRRAPNDVPWCFEAPCRHAVRRLAVTGGSMWREADAAAAKAVLAARRLNGTREPEGWDSERTERTCAVCGEAMDTCYQHQKYCGYRCQRVAMNALAREHREETKPFEVACVSCGKVFPRNPKSKPQMYCSNACKIRAHRARKGR